MSSFTTPLIVELQDDGKSWKIMQEFDYEEGMLGSGKIFRVPVGFITDFASIPKIFWNILPPIGRYGKAAVLHDYLYNTQPFQRVRCDDLFLEAMGALNVNWMTRHIMYRAVRMFGWLAWNNNTKKRETKLGR